MRDKLSLSIPKPCSEKWSSFEKTSDGGYCSSCSKVVVDFTTMSDEEIVSYFKSKPSHTCGRFRPEQIKQYSMGTSKWNLMPRLNAIKVGALSIGFLFLSKEVSAIPRPLLTEISEPQPKSVNTIDDNTVRRFKGRCIDGYDNTGLPGVNVVIKGTQTGTVTDMNGYFELDVKEGDVLVFTFIGLRSQEHTVKKDMKPEFVMEFEMLSDLTGEVVVDGIYSSDLKSPGLWARIKALF